jgi:hypothetical protein
VTENNHNTQLENGTSKARPRAYGPDSKFKIQNSRGLVPDSLFPIPHLSPQQLQFLLRVAPGALESEREYQVPACITLAQSILESATTAGWGSSSLFRIANNPFGIKFSHRAIEPSDDRSNDGQQKQSTGIPLNRSTDGLIPGSPAPNGQHPAPSPTPAPSPYGAFNAETWEIVDGQKKVMMAQFQRFPNLTEAFKAHAQLLCSPHYRPAFAVRHDWKQFAERLGPKTSPLDSEHCGYSTNPSYSAELIKLVELYRLDDSRVVEWFATGKSMADSSQLTANSLKCPSGESIRQYEVSIKHEPLSRASRVEADGNR